MTQPSRFDKILDYFPIAAYLGFYLQGAVLGALAIGDPRLMKLGVVTLPAVAAVVIAVWRIGKLHMASGKGDEEKNRGGAEIVK